MARHHHLDLAPSHPSSPHPTAPTSPAPAPPHPSPSVPLRGYDPLYHGPGLGDRRWRPGQRAHPLRKAWTKEDIGIVVGLEDASLTSALLRHLDLTAAVGLEPGDLLPAPPYDHADHLVGDHDLLGGHAPGHAALHVGEGVGEGSAALDLARPAPEIVVERSLEAARAALAAPLGSRFDFSSNLRQTGFFQRIRDVCSAISDKSIMPAYGGNRNSLTNLKYYLEQVKYAHPES